MANPSHDKGKVTGAGGGHDPGCLRRGGSCACGGGACGKEARATPPSPSTAPMCERKTAKLEEEGYAKTGYVLRQPGKDREVVVSDGGAVSWFTAEQWNWLMFNRDHVEFNWPKPLGARLATSTAPEVDERAAFEKAMNDRRFFPAEFCFARTKSPSGRDEYANSHLQSNWEGWQARAALASRPAEVDDEGLVVEIKRDRVWIRRGVQSFMLAYEVESMEEAEWYAGQLRHALSIFTPRVNRGISEVDDEGLPTFPAPAAAWMVGRNLYLHHDAIPAGLLPPIGNPVPLFTAEQNRQGQRDAVAADRARRAAVGGGQ